MARTLTAELIAIAERHLGHRLSIGVFQHTATLGELLDRLS